MQKSANCIGWSAAVKCAAARECLPRRSCMISFIFFLGSVLYHPLIMDSLYTLPPIDDEWPVHFKVCRIVLQFVFYTQ